MPSIAKSTLEQLRLKVAAGPTPAGVAVAAVAASLALSLLAMSLEVSAGKKSATGSRVALGRMRRAAARESLRMLDYADRDVAAFDAYLKSRRRGARPRAVNAALTRAIETPLKIARAAIGGLELCLEAAPLVHRAVAADLGTGAAMLAAAARAAARSAESNLRYVAPGNPARKRVLAERRLLERRAGAMLQRILKIIG
ncbi:MAG TPA: cyclodeaminase/cyclohydrolase family protein [Candidatus Binataceae bacterium]|nr:cyclodeaminase/cyclohydrolase family protein [Candidatus Binataceae bacterium]